VDAHTLAVYVTRCYTMQMQPYAPLIIVSADYAKTTAGLMFGPYNRSQIVLIPVINSMVPEKLSESSWLWQPHCLVLPSLQTLPP